MRWIVYLVLGFVVAGCGESEPVPIYPEAAKTPTTYRSLPPTGEPLPVRVTKPKQDLVTVDEVSKLPQVNSAGSFTDRVIDRLEQDTIRMAGFAAKTTGRCAGGRVKLGMHARTTCSVTYRGKTVKWEVTMLSPYTSGDYILEYRATPLQAVLLRDAVYAEWYRVATDGDQPRCSAMPAIQVVTVDEPTPYRCQQLIPQYGYQAPHWKNSSYIQVTDAGIVFNA